MTAFIAVKSGKPLNFKLPNISEILMQATEILQAGGIAESRREAASLLSFALQKDKTFLIAHTDYELSDDEETRFRNLLVRRAAREPFQYITGEQEFYGLDFWVTPDVLIPRPETELIVENAIEILRGKQNAFFCEVGVGSGCISVSILRETKGTSAIGLDISEKALQVARRNAERHRVLERIALKTSDVFAALKDEKFDLIVSNPPYISLKDVANLQAEVRAFEPLTALTDNQDGLSIVEKIIVAAPDFLKPSGFLLMEIGFNQSNKVRGMFSPDKWRSIEFLQDLQGIPRTVKAKIKENE
jgi:release factor glutamine methyltransferase